MGAADNLLRAIGYAESGWQQANYGDFVRDRAACPAGFRRLPCPVTFGIVGTKSTSWPGIYPWNRESTAAAVDVLGGWLRGCYQGWVWWLRQHGNRSHGVYHARDLWGCVGAWYSGNWLDGSPGTPRTGEYYLHRLRHWYRVRPGCGPGSVRSGVIRTVLGWRIGPAAEYGPHAPADRMDGFRLAYDRAGQGPAVLLLHGWRG